MRRAIFTMTAALVLTLATALPVASSGLTDVTLSCDDGSSFTATLDTESLEGVTQAVLAMGLFPAGLSCSLATVPVVHALGGVASAWPGGGFIVGGSSAKTVVVRARGPSLGVRPIAGRGEGWRA